VVEIHINLHILILFRERDFAISGMLSELCRHLSIEVKKADTQIEIGLSIVLGFHASDFIPGRAACGSSIIIAEHSSQ
jgi:hypothetical protein